MATTPNVFQELQTALEEFKALLKGPDAQKIKNLIKALKDLFPDIVVLIDNLIELLGKLETAIKKLEIPGGDVGEIVDFAKKVENLVVATKALLPAGDDSTDEVLGALGFIASIPGITDGVKNAIIVLIGEVVTELKLLKAA